MPSLLSSTLNTRFLPLGEGRFIRSDAPLHITPEEAAWLASKGVTTLVDLRSAEEVRRSPCPLQEREGFAYVHMPVTGGGATPASREKLLEVYCGMADGQMERILQTILASRTGVMFFCTAGKDRTGVVSALLLRLLGADDAAIVADYMKSRENLLEMLTAYAAEHPEASLDVIVPREENIRAVLAMTAKGGAEREQG